MKCYLDVDGSVYENKASAVKAARDWLYMHPREDRVYINYLNGTNRDCIWVIVGRKGANPEYRTVSNYMEVSVPRRR